MLKKGVVLVERDLGRNPLSEVELKDLFGDRDPREFLNTRNELYRTIAKVIGKKRRLAHIPIGVARAGARATQWLPGAPVTTDQIAMIEAGDNALSNTDAVQTFQLPLVALEEQIRRAA